MSEETNTQASWLQILDSINLEIMRSNEHELGTTKAVVDFETMGQFPERIGGLFDALKLGLKKADVEILGATLLILPSQTGTGITEPLVVLWNLTKGARWASRFVGNDLRACRKSAQSACSEANVESSSDVDHIVQIPYFVKASDKYYSKNNYPVEDLIYRRPHIFRTDDSNAGAWIEQHSASDYVQRFLFTVVCKGSESAIAEIFFTDEGSHISHLIGAFFSWVGVAADEVTRFQVERMASFQLLRTHQLGNKLAEIFFKFERENLEVLDQEGRNPTPQSVMRIRQLLTDHKRDIDDLREKIAQFSQVASTFGARPAELNWYAEFVHFLGTLGAHTDDGGQTYLVSRSTRWSSGSRFDLRGIDSRSKRALITFSKYHFPELIENLYKNAKRAWERPENETTRQSNEHQGFRISAKLVNGNMELSFANQGPEISDSLKAKLFKQPVAKAEGSSGNGVGLWALGMAFKTFGLPAPKVENIARFGTSFVFTFPANLKD